VVSLFICSPTAAEKKLSFSMMLMLSWPLHNTYIPCLYVSAHIIYSFIACISFVCVCILIFQARDRGGGNRTQDSLGLGDSPENVTDIPFVSSVTLNSVRFSAPKKDDIHSAADLKDLCYDKGRSITNVRSCKLFVLRRGLRDWLLTLCQKLRTKRGHQSRK
jgi:hypothetical protein